MWIGMVEGAVQTDVLVVGAGPAGLPFAAVNVFPDARPPAVRVPLDGEANRGDTEFPYWLSVPQVEVERCLERRLTSLGGQVEWGQGLLELDQDGNGVQARLAGEQGHARWLVGCDGGRSTLRDRLGIRMERRRDGQLFVLADVLTRDGFPNDEGRVYRIPVSGHIAPEFGRPDNVLLGRGCGKPA